MNSTRDRALWAILFSNLVAVGMNWALGGEYLVLLWTYWIQSVVIGIFAWKRIRILKKFTANGLTANGKPVPTTPEGARDTAASFAAVYLGFHFFYAVALFAFSSTAEADGTVLFGEKGTYRFQVGVLDVLDAVAILVGGLLFFLSHRLSHREHAAADVRGCPDIGVLSFYPMMRIIPMHLTFLFGMFLGARWIVLFGLLKTGVDLLMHWVEHMKLQDRYVVPAEEADS